ncbi:unnamed protein product [Rhodiola kirilowii]
MPQNPLPTSSDSVLTRFSLLFGRIDPSLTYSVDIVLDPPRTMIWHAYHGLVQFLGTLLRLKLIAGYFELMSISISH